MPVLLASSPSAAGAEWVASEWLLDLLNLPANLRRFRHRSDDGQLHLSRRGTS